MKALRLSCDYEVTCLLFTVWLFVNEQMLPLEQMNAADLSHIDLVLKGVVLDGLQAIGSILLNTFQDKLKVKIRFWFYNILKSEYCF